MDDNLQSKLNILKLGYIKKLETMVPEFEILSKKMDCSHIDELYSKVHTISGTSGMYGLKDLSDFSTDFEIYLKEIKNDPNCYNEVILKEKLTNYIKNVEKIVKGDNNG